MQSQRYESSQRLVKNDIMIHVTSFSKCVAPVCSILSAVGRFIEKFTNASLQNDGLHHEAPLHKISSVTSMSQRFLCYSLYCCCFISAYSFHNYLSLYGS